MKVRISSFGKSEDKRTEFESQYDWQCGCQAGSNGVVMSKGGNYNTAFFEAFPNKPSCFLRGEGPTVELAEEECWRKYQQVLSCNHEMERRNRKDGYGYCKHCSYSAIVFEPLTKCRRCQKPTRFACDYKDRWYCEKHSQAMPRNRNGKENSWLFSDRKDFRLPRKMKKAVKKGAQIEFQRSGCYGKVVARFGIGASFECRGFSLSIIFKRQYADLIKLGKTKKRK